MPKPRALCFLAAAVLYAVGITGVATLGALVKVNIALMLIAFATGFLVAAILLGVKPRTARDGAR